MGAGPFHTPRGSDGPLRRVRSGGGVTSAAGATAGFSRCSEALGLVFPLDIAATTGWSSKLRSNTVQPQIPIEVAELVHFDYHAKYNPSPFVRAICATQWFSFLWNMQGRPHTEILSLEEMRQCMVVPLQQGQGQVEALQLRRPGSDNSR